MNWNLYFSVVTGVITSVLLPILIISIKTQFSNVAPASVDETAFMRFVRIAWPHVRKYLTLLIFSLLTSLVVFAFLGNKLAGLGEAFIAGYAWDSTIQKILKPN